MQNADTVLEAAKKIIDFYAIDCGDIDAMDFSKWPKLPKGRGVYAILDNNEIVYVGRGNIKARQKSHHKKLVGALTKHDNKEPEGWVHVRKNRGVNYDELKLVVIFLRGKDDEAAMEGGLIKILQPYVNDEIFSKNFKLGNV